MIEPNGLPPLLPRGEVMAVPGVGELFLRRADGPLNATPVLLLHGWQATADLNFAPLYAPLAAQHPVIAFDLRGHGRSMYPEQPFNSEDAADDAAALMRALAVPSAIVLGYATARHRATAARPQPEVARDRAAAT